MKYNIHHQVEVEQIENKLSGSGVIWLDNMIVAE